MSDKLTPLDLGYYDSAINKIELFIDKNEELYEELHSQFENNQPSGFTLGFSKTSVETAKTLSTIRSTALTGAKMLFDARSKLGDLELKKKQTNIDLSKTENDKEFIRQALNEIVLIKTNQNEIKNSPDKHRLNSILAAKEEAGEIQLTNNEKSMKYDDKVMPVFDSVSGEIKAVLKNTNTEVIGYPIERFQINKIIKTDDEKAVAYTDKGKLIPIMEVDGDTVNV